MMNYIRLLLVLSVVGVSGLGAILVHGQWSRTVWSEGVVLTLTMLDVGQGDAIHIRDANGVDLLIDGGRGDAVLQELSKTMPWSDRTIEYVLLTHPDADHVEGLVHVLDRYRIDTLLTTGNRAGTQIDSAYSDRFAAAQRVEQVGQGTVIEYDHWTLEFLWHLSSCISVHEKNDTNTHCEHERNDRSVVAMLQSGRVRALLTGDIERSAEEELLERYSKEKLQADILKVAHHGSTTSSYTPLLDVVRARDALISAGVDNAYGHPHQSTLQRLQQRGVRIWRTDTQEAVQCRFYEGSYECRSLIHW